MRHIVGRFSIVFWSISLFSWLVIVLRFIETPHLWTESNAWTKEELVKLLSDQLKTSVRRIYYMEGGGIKEGWEIRYDNPLTPSEYMDKVDRKHFRKYPNESFTTFLDRYKLWDSPTFSLW